MTVTITHATSSQTAVLDHVTIRTRLPRPSTNLVHHPVAGVAGGPDVTFNFAATRTGDVEMRTTSLEAVEDVQDLHATFGGPLRIVDTVTGLDMYYVLERDGAPEVDYDDDRNEFIVTLRGVVEVYP